MSLDPQPANPRLKIRCAAALLCQALVCVSASFALSATGWAQQDATQNRSTQDAPASRRVLHEYFDPWSVQISGQIAPRKGSASGGAGTGSIQGTPGQPPGLSLQPATDEMILGDQGPVDAGATAAPWGPLDPGAGAPSRLDASTDRVDQLNYWANFEPSVVPYKRVVVQNQVRSVDGEYSLHLVSGRFSGVTIEGGAARGDEEVFWGSFLLRARGGQRHPIPSVSPDQRILSVQVAPMMGLQIERDEADNFYIVPASDGLLRVNMKVAAPRDYFSGALSEAVTWRQLSQSPHRRDTRLSGPIKRVAADVLKLSGASTQMTPRDALYALVEYYRDFEARPFPQALAKDDLYTAISREQIGVCRHRSLAFVISARALGIPARYIYNEAHAFVEVYWPKMGWRRIDLGGAAEQLDYAGRRGGGVHQAELDALPQPPNYMSELERMGVDVSAQGSEGPGGEDGGGAGQERSEGASQDDTAGSQVSGAETQTAARDEAEEVGETDESGEVDEFATEQAALASGDGQEDDALAAPTDALEEGTDPLSDEGAATQVEPPDQALSEDASADLTSTQEKPDVPVDDRKAVRIDVVASNTEVFRGTALDLKGSIFSVQGRAIKQAALRVYLGPVGVESTEGLVLLGELESDSGGRFEGQFAIPDDVAIGRWSVILRFEGNEQYRPAQVD